MSGQDSKPRLRDHGTRLGKFGAVGLVGLVVNTALLALVSGVIGINYLWGATISTQGSTVSNYVLTRLWVFRDREPVDGARGRFAKFWLMNNVALLARGPFLWLLTSWLGVHYLLSNVFTLACLMLIRYGLAAQWIWPESGRLIGARETNA